jgi:hypothetical protein
MSEGNPVEFHGLDPQAQEVLKRAIKFGSLFPLKGPINVPPNVLTDLGALLSTLGLPPLLAPLAIWVAARIRDVGMPVLCKSTLEYFEQKETNP